MIGFLKKLPELADAAIFAIQPGRFLDLDRFTGNRKNIAASCSDTTTSPDK